MIPALVLSAALSPARPAALAPVTVTINVVSRERKPVNLEFQTSDAFFVQVRDENAKVVFDSRSGHQPIPVHRTLTFTTGTNHVASYDWNGLTDQRRAPLAPGKYTLHVEMPGVQTTLAADLPLAIEPPSTIASALAATRPAYFTITGTPEGSGAAPSLRDDTGTIRLSHPLGLFPQGTFVVRGTVERSNLGTRFAIERSAPATGNDAPQGTPTPRATATPKL